MAQFPKIRDQLMVVATSRDALQRIEGTLLGKLAKAKPDVDGALRTLFPENPLPGREPAIIKAVSGVVEYSPGAARQLVRVQAESIFNTVSKAAAGPSQWNGASFAAALRNNPELAGNLAAGISALPEGANLVKGFDRFLDVMQATGERQRLGSLTSFNTEALANMKNGGAANLAAEAVTTAGIQLPRRIREAFQRWNLGQNTDEVARILTDPKSADLFRHLATTNPTSTKAAALAARLASIGMRGAHSGPAAGGR